MSKNQVTIILAVIAASLIGGVSWVVNRSESTEIEPSRSPKPTAAPEPAKAWTAAELEANCRSLFPEKLELPEDSIAVANKGGKAVDSLPQNPHVWEASLRIDAGFANIRPFRCQSANNGVDLIRRPDNYATWADELYSEE